MKWWRLGRGIQAQALVAETSKMLLLDVTPLSLGITVAGGYSAILIPKNTTVPTSATHIFTTVRDYQTSVKIMVLVRRGAARRRERAARGVSAFGPPQRAAR